MVSGGAQLVSHIATRMVAEPDSSWGMYSSPPGRQESGGSFGAIQRNRDGVPVWNGEPSSLEEFTEACLRYEQTVVKEKRYLCGPRIASELRGPAKRVLLGKQADWLSFDGGVRKLIETLRQGRGQPMVPEMSELLMKYFKGTKRVKGESMGDYVTRKAEAYTRAQQSMARYLQEQRPSSTSRTWTSGGGSRWSDRYSRSGRSSRPSAPSEREGPGTALGSEVGEHEVIDGEGAEEPDQPGAEGRDGLPAERSWWHDPEDGWGGWHRDWWWRQPWYQNWSHSDHTYDTTEWSRHQLPEILPEFIQGWYLLIDSGLDVMERNVLQAELRGDFKVQSVEDVLRKHWHDADLRRRDSEKGKFMANIAELEGEDPEWACLGDWDPDQLEAEGYSLEEIEAMAAEQETQKEALVAFQEAKRTLKEARARQHAVKTSRQFYSVRSRMSSTGGKGSGKDGPLKCFRCGGPHKVAQCPEKPKESANVSVPEESAPFVFLAEAESVQEESAWMSTEMGQCPRPALTTAQVVEEGKAVLDGGATRSIGSIYALSKVLELNEARRGEDGLKELDMEDRPSFGFGNSSRDRCASTASLAVPWNGAEKVLKVHALDKGTSPVLLSIHSLRRLGAIIDFECDKAVFRNVDPRKVVKLERSAAGHQVLPLTEDAFQDALELEHPVPAFDDLG